MESSPFSGSSKSTKSLHSSTKPVANCLVDGCEADLTLCRDYHRRHKVCETHSKTPKVTIGGKEQRFCQQCSRFHSLVEFDEGKRSCRKRLDGHNRRRRKPQLDPLVRNSGLFASGQPSSFSSSRFLSFGNTPILPNSLTWPGVIKSETDMFLYSSNQHHPVSYNGRPDSLLFTGLLNHQNQFHDESTSYIAPAAVNFGFGSSKMLSEGLNHRHQNTACDRAFSLLSSASQNIAISQEQALVPDINYDGFSSSGQYRGGSSNTCSTLYFPEMFHHGEASSPGEPHQTHSSMWE